MSIDEARELDTLTYNLLLRDAVCLKYQETPAGQDYLRECWRLQQTEPDMEELIKYRDRRLN